jgi:hypothetical protein
MGRSLAALAFLAIISIVHPAQAARFSGDYLLQVCASDKNGKELVQGGHVACQSYISGVVDYHNLIRSLGGAPSVEFCVPEQTGLNELQRVVADYLFRHKKQHGAFVASPAVALALYNAYPCGKKGK